MANLFDIAQNPQRLVDAWRSLSRLPFGDRLFSRLVGMAAPYTGTVRGRFIEVRPGYARAQLRDRRRVRNHLRSVHAVALMNLGEMTTGLAMMSQVPAGGRGIVTGLAMEYRKKSRGTITCESQAPALPGPGRHDLQVEGILRDQSGDTVAIARATWRLDIPG